jgi:inner membrane protein
VGCAALAALLFLGVVAWLRWRGHRIRLPEAWLFGAMSLLAVMLHLGMDALNEYGVHPFWPWNNRWYYGDTMFIVEPLCWLATAPLLCWLRSRGARVSLGLVLAVGCIAVLVFHRFGAVWWIVPVLTALLLHVGGKLSPRAASLASVVILCGVIGTFSAAHAAVSRRVESLAARQFPAATTLDIVLSPAPAHPFCWDVMLLQRAQGAYTARLGQLSLTSDLSAACARNLGGAGTAPLKGMQVPVTSGMRWSGQFSMEANSLARLGASNCDTRRLASFLRAPFAVETDKGWILGDLRYDREPGPGFAELLVDSHGSTRCSRPSPWTPPRRDLGF